jgi:hypothetical protein
MQLCVQHLIMYLHMLGFQLRVVQCGPYLFIYSNVVHTRSLVIHIFNHHGGINIHHFHPCDEIYCSDCMTILNKKQFNIFQFQHP